jgi:uncharacterized protein with von Willebrand factor type A (vWA) domain
MSAKKPTSKSRRPLGGLIHAYQKYDPKNFPSPNKPEPDLASAAFEHMMQFGSLRRLTPEELANAIQIDPSQIAGLGPSLESLIKMLEERRRKILETYETSRVMKEAADAVEKAAKKARVPKRNREAFERSVRQEQIRDLERLWYGVERSDPEFAADLLRVTSRLGEKYQVEELDADYEFTGRVPMDVPRALEIKEELEAIDRLIEQLREAMENAQIALVDMEALAEFVQEADIDQLRDLQQQVEDYMRDMAERQGLELDDEGNYQLTPQAYRTFQGKLLQEIFSDLEASRSGRHEGRVTGDGAVELPRTKAYEFGDSPTHMDVPQSMINALLREAGAKASEDYSSDSPGIRMRSEDIEIHQTRNNPKCATCIIMDMSGSMRYGGLFIDAKRMALAMDGLIRREYPGDFLQFVEMATFAAPRHISEVPQLLPKPVTIYDPVVRLRVDMSREDVTESVIPPHFTNIQHGFKLARQFLTAQDTPNRQIILITDGLPTAHFDDSMLYLLYPPDPLTEQMTMREAMACAREQITINVFLVPSWSQSEEDVRFAQRMAQATSGRVFFTGGHDLDRYVLWDYVNNRRKILG